MKAIKNNPKVKVSATTVETMLGQTEQMERIARYWREKAEQKATEVVNANRACQVWQIATVICALSCCALAVGMVLS